MREVFLGLGDGHDGDYYTDASDTSNNHNDWGRGTIGTKWGATLTFPIPS